MNELLKALEKLAIYCENQTSDAKALGAIFRIDPYVIDLLKVYKKFKLNIEHLTHAELIERFCQLEARTDSLQDTLRRVATERDTLARDLEKVTNERETLRNLNADRLLFIESLQEQIQALKEVCDER